VRLEENRKILAARKEVSEVDWTELPDLSGPAVVRDFLYQWNQSLQYYWDQICNWWLQCDERSLLSQQDQPDIRRANVKKLREITGKIYGKKVRQLLEVHDRMVLVMEDEKIEGHRHEELWTVE
jgi:hypothetical protein